MADPLTTNVQLAVPTRGSDVGTWDVPVNGDFTLIDSMFGSVGSLALTNLPVTLATSQAQVSIIRLTGTLTGNVSITLPSIYKFWTVDNQLTNSPSSFCATLISTAGTSIIGLPPGPQDVFYDGTTVNYKNLGKLGEYWDYASEQVPSWVTNCSKVPYLFCNGGTFSSAAYPQLANLLGSTTLPDFRGRNSYFLNSGSGRLTSSGTGIDGNTIFASGGTDGITLGSTQIPTLVSSGTITVISSAPGGFASVNTGPIQNIQVGGGATGAWSPFAGAGVWFGAGTLTGANSMTYANASPSNVKVPAPGAVSGIRMIRAM